MKVFLCQVLEYFSVYLRENICAIHPVSLKLIFMFNRTASVYQLIPIPNELKLANVHKHANGCMQKYKSCTHGRERGKVFCVVEEGR